jgi:hypothetical protein
MCILYLVAFGWLYSIWTAPVPNEIRSIGILIWVIAFVGMVALTLYGIKIWKRIFG